MTSFASLASVLELEAPLRVAFLGRVSNEEKQDPSLSIPRQHRAVVDRCGELNWSITGCFWDIESGRKELELRGDGADGSLFAVDVPRDGGLPQLLDAARRREIDVVMVEQIDRLSRSTADSTAIERELMKLDIPIFATDEPINLNATTLLTRRVKQAIAEWYVADLLEKSRKGMEESVRQGWHTGSPIAYGYIGERHPHPNPHKAAAGETKTRLVPCPVRGAIVSQFDDRSPGASELTGHPKSLQVKEAVLTEAVFEFLARRVFRPERLELLQSEIVASASDPAADFAADLERLHKEQVALERKIERSYDEIEASESSSAVTRIARKRIEDHARELELVEAQIAELEVEGSEVASADPVDLEALLRSIPDLSAALASYGPEELRELFEAFDLEVRFDKRNDSAEISIALIPELLDGIADFAGAAVAPETTRPATRAGLRSRDIAGAVYGHISPTASATGSPRFGRWNRR